MSPTERWPKRVTALQKVGRTLERQARFAQARARFHEALSLHSRDQELDDTAMGRTHLFLGWLEYRQGGFPKARQHYYRALELARGKRDDWLVGHVYNALGLLERRRDDYPEALTLFRTALDYWCRVDYAYGIAAAYANIGTAHKCWGDHLRDHRFPQQAARQYRHAVEWLTRCLQFSAAARLGEDTSLAQGMLAETHFELGEVGEAWTMAREARQAAARAGNEIDLAEAILTLAKLHALRGDGEQARQLLTDARARFQRVGWRGRAARIAQQLRGLGTLGQNYASGQRKTSLRRPAEPE